MSAATAYIIGTNLGKGDKENAKKVAFNLIGAALMLGVLAGLVLFFIRGPLVNVYEVNDNVKNIAMSLLATSALYFPV
jgi:Na+-driven multidrug efflux pump